jgi:hypothetical protein
MQFIQSETGDIESHAKATAICLNGDLVAGADACPNYLLLDERCAWIDVYVIESIKISLLSSGN